MTIPYAVMLNAARLVRFIDSPPIAHIDLRLVSLKRVGLFIGFTYDKTSSIKASFAFAGDASRRRRHRAGWTGGGGNDRALEFVPRFFGGANP